MAFLKYFNRKLFLGELLANTNEIRRKSRYESTRQNDVLLCRFEHKEDLGLLALALQFRSHKSKMESALVLDVKLVQKSTSVF